MFDRVTRSAARAVAPSAAVGLDDALELLHFGFREIVREPDRILARRRLGRVHHRILYMCRRNLDLTVGELLAILDVSKQALHRPVGDLVRAGLLIVERDPIDGRARRLRLSAKGRALEEQISGLQRRAFERAFSDVGDEGARAWAAVMSAIGSGKSAAGLRAKAQRRRQRGAR
jgi:DNA-binding MarR family transcriptional regulator